MDEQLPEPEIDDLERVGGNGFEVRHFKGMQWAFGPYVPGNLQERWFEPSEYWSVELPHQCDAWDIACDGDFETVVTGLEAFIAEAQEALGKLRGMAPPCNPAGRTSDTQPRAVTP